MKYLVPHYKSIHLFSQLYYTHVFVQRVKQTELIAKPRVGVNHWWAKSHIFFPELLNRWLDLAIFPSRINEELQLSWKNWLKYKTKKKKREKEINRELRRSYRQKRV